MCLSQQFGLQSSCLSSITAVRLFAHVCIDETAETRVSKRKPNTAPLDLCASSHEGEQIVCFSIHIHVKGSAGL